MGQMTHLERVIVWFNARHNHATLREILTSGEPWSYEWRARATELRHKGFVITYERGVTPSDNTYTVIPPEENGQTRLCA